MELQSEKPRPIKCSVCDTKFETNKVIKKTKTNVFISDKRLKPSEVEDIMTFGFFSPGEVYVCPKCHCTYSK